MGDRIAEDGCDTENRNELCAPSLGRKKCPVGLLLGQLLGAEEALRTPVTVLGLLSADSDARTAHSSNCHGSEHSLSTEGALGVVVDAGPVGHSGCGCRMVGASSLTSARTGSVSVALRSATVASFSSTRTSCMTPCVPMTARWPGQSCVSGARQKNAGKV
jgi:hypothetical protein